MFDIFTLLITAYFGIHTVSTNGIHRFIERY